MEKSNRKTLAEIQLIEESKSEDLLHKEFEKALGDANCATYIDGKFQETCHGGYVNSLCEDGKNRSYYQIYTCDLWT